MFDWITNEPLIGLLSLVVCALYFGMLFIRSRASTGMNQPWMYSFIASLVQAIFIFGMLVGFRQLIDKTVFEFREQRVKLFRETYEAIETQWGGNVMQQDLSVEHYVENEELVELSGESGTKLYKTITQHEILAVNSIEQFRGYVDLTLSHEDVHVAGAELFNTLMVNARYEFVVRNPSEQIAITRFRFQLPSNARLLEDFFIIDNGVHMAGDATYADSTISWSREMHPNEKAYVVIQYSTKAHNDYQYIVSEQRRILDFELEFYIFDDNYVYLIDSSHNQYFSQTISTSPYRTWTWQLDEILTTADLGISYAQYRTPYNPYHDINAILPLTPNAYVFLVALVLLTAIIQGTKVSPFDVLLISGSFLALVLSLTISFDLVGFKNSLFIGALAYAVLVLPWILRQQSVLLRSLFITLSILFAFGYPLIGLLDLDSVKQNTVTTGIFAGVILYLFILTLLTRIYSRHRIAS